MVMLYERFVSLAWHEDNLVVNGEEIPVKAIGWRVPSPFQDYGR
ncbi:MAG: hypothetical protein PHE17_01580 [Thiothrix sp.]|nr:hypothetical protein [Thiothrix sp.]MDD5391688.1 hypothetical protein [Thiothrix sp.]